MKKTVVLYPGLAVSHFVPMMRLADVLLEAGYAVTVVLIDPSLKEDIAFASVVDRVISSKPSITFHKLPRIQDPPTIIHDNHFLTRYFDLVGRHNSYLHDFLCSMPPRNILAIIVDAASFIAVDVTKKLGIRTYNFFATNASFLAISYQLPSIYPKGQPSLKELGDTPLNFHGVLPIPTSHLFDFTEMLEDSKIEKNKMKMRLGFDGTLVNTFTSLEARAVGALKDLQCFPTIPPVYCVGPLVEEAGVKKEKHECLTWLDQQPEHSVVYLCFGSIGVGNHSKGQLKEIAIGLEKSGHRFLWVVRAPAHDDPKRLSDPRAVLDLDSLLPEGFLERTKGRGLIVKLWAPQVDVLHHRATGAFVTHCGWNSVLEAIIAGVPMLCWPLYAEQKMNKLFMVEEARVGVEMVGWQQGLVMADEVEAKVRLVMESEEGKRLRSWVMEQKKAAAMAWEEGGSSQVAFVEFLSQAINGSLEYRPARP